jgi:hypothetical protein
VRDRDFRSLLETCRVRDAGYVKYVKS